MANSFDELLGMINKLIKDATRYYVPRIGIVSKVIDPLKKSRILVHIPSFNWMTDDVGAWCYPKDKNALITPAIGTFVLVEFIDGDKNLPVYSGTATQMKDMLPGNYDGEDTTQIIFEDKSKETYVKYDEKTKKFIIEDSFGNKITLKNGEITIEGTAIKLLGGGEAFVKGNTLDTWITGTLKAVFDVHVHSGVTTGAGISGPPAASLTAPSNHLSTVIEGE